MTPVVLFVAACASTPPQGSANPPRSDPRERAPAVALDPRAPLPEAEALARTEAGVVVLNAPHNCAVARDTVRRFFQAVMTEDLIRLETLLDPGAQVSSDSRGTRWQAFTFWRLRFSRLDYAELAGRIVFQDSAVETYSAEDLAAIEPFRKISVDLEPSQVLVRTPIETTTVDGQRLFGDEMAFVLAPDKKAYTIVHIVEPFSLP